MTDLTNPITRPGNFPRFSGKYGRMVGTTPLTWHNKAHDRTWSAIGGASSRRLQACLQRELSAGLPPVARPLSPGSRRPSPDADVPGR
nr:hypothetical protein [Nocardia transvalensis]